jgi:Ni,Fe-hydrogenase III large subunit
VVTVDGSDLAATLAQRVGAGARVAAMLATARADGSTTLLAVLARSAHLDVVESHLEPGRSAYPSVARLVPPAAWYEREIHDLFGLVPEGHPRLDPLVLPQTGGAHTPRPGGPGGSGGPGSSGGCGSFAPDTAALPADVVGEGMFTIPYGPVRSGVFETIEYLIETFGEDIPSIRPRVHHKHRGLDGRFGELGADEAVLLAERVEGVASVAHAMAFSQAVEHLAGVVVPRPAELLRVVHAELERVANHLDSIVRHCEGAGQAVAYARLSTHKERVMRLRSRLGGHRFGRGVVVPGGVTAPPRIPIAALLADVERVERAVASDIGALMVTPSFLDRLRKTGPVPHDVAAAHGALGPVGRGSGLVSDVRVERPYGAYRSLGFDVAVAQDGDALGRQHVRVAEISQAFHLVHQALDELARDELRSHGERDPVGAGDPLRWRALLPATATGTAVASVEAPQGELLYLVEMAAGRLVRVKPRSASFHNLVLFPGAFQGDIFTDFVFIEASFGLSFAGVAG